MAATVHLSDDIQRIGGAISGAFSMFPQVVTALRCLEKHMETALGPGEPAHLLIMGETGTGKTRILRHFAARHTPIHHEELTEVPLIYVEVPARTTIKQMAGLLLHAMGSPYWNKGDEAARTMQLHTLLRACRTRMIILDEVNHLVDRGGVKTHYHVADWVKQLGGAGMPTLVLAGTPRSEALLATNEQLRGRFGQTLRIQPLSANGEHIKLFSRVLRTFASLLHPIECIDLGDPIVARQVAFATGGRLRVIRNLLRKAVEIAAEEEAPRIDGRVLEKAFIQAVYGNATAERNPFNAKFNGLALVKAGEPFACEVKHG